jgi:hypothetical protein
MAAQTWSTIQTAVIQALANASPPYTAVTPDFTIAFPQATSYAENRICRDMPMLANRAQNTQLMTTAGSRSIDLTTMNNITADDQTNPGGGPIIVVDGFALISPAGTSNPALGLRIPYTQTSLDWIDQFWPQQSVVMDPAAADWIGRYWALRDDHTIIIAPTPDAPLGAVYTAEITGLFQPTPISQANPQTYLSTYYPDLLECAIMIFMSGWLQRNFSSQSDDPKMAVSWESQYEILLKSAMEEEQRRRGQGIGWSNMSMSEAQPARS